MASGMNVITVSPSNIVVSERHWLRNVGELLVVFTTSVVVICGNIPMIGHTTEINLVTIVERSIERFTTIVPLPGAPCLITGSA